MRCFRALVMDNNKSLKAAHTGEKKPKERRTIMKYNDENICMGKSSQSQVMSGTFFEALQSVREQIDIECFFESDQKQVNEIMMLIAEMYRLPPDAEVQINGQKLPASMVRDVYSLLTEEHIREVITNYEKAEYTIKFKKTYLRTALYNEVFEHESRFVNGFRTAFPEYGTNNH